MEKLMQKYPDRIIAAAGSRGGKSQIFIAPFVALANDPGNTNTLRAPEGKFVFPVTFDLTESELKSIQSIRCTVGNIAVEK